LVPLQALERAHALSGWYDKQLLGELLSGSIAHAARCRTLRSGSLSSNSGNPAWYGSAMGTSDIRAVIVESKNSR
jgi:hypothetical protein